MSPDPTQGIFRRFADLRHGQLHYVEAGDHDAPVLLLLHQTPRSWREYAAVVPLLARRWRVIAMDTPGFGDSEAGTLPASIVAWAAAAHELLDHLRVARAHVVGHHTGGVIAVELAAAHPDRVASLILSSTPLTDAAFRQARAHALSIDEVEPRPDGSHLAQLWGRRQPYYPAGRPELLEAFVADALRAECPVEQGHRAVAAYEMEHRLDLIRQPLCVFHAAQDPFASRHTAHWRERFPHCGIEVFEQGAVPLPDQLPEEFARAVDAFVQRREIDRRSGDAPADANRFTCIDGAALAPATAYRLLSGAVVPRPIAWVTSMGAGTAPGGTVGDGIVNAAPFSAYNYVSTHPPMIAISIEGNASTGGLKDTARNMLARREFVVNVADESVLEDLHLSARAYPPDVSEVEALGLPLLPSRHVAVPRIASTPIQMECRLAQVIPLGEGSNTLYIGEVLAVHVSDRVYDGGRIDQSRLRPLGRLGGPLYTSRGRLHERSPAASTGPGDAPREAGTH